MYYTGERTFQDMKRWNPLIGKTFYERNPKNDKDFSFKKTKLKN